MSALVAIWFALGAIYGCAFGPMLRKALTEPCDEPGGDRANRDRFARSVSAPFHSNDNTQGGQRHHGH